MSKIFYILDILTDHIAISQLATVKSQEAGVYMIRENAKKNEIYVEIGSGCATFYISYTHTQYFQFSR